jgi:hypothetical protein
MDCPPGKQYQTIHQSWIGLCQSQWPDETRDWLVARQDTDDERVKYCRQEYEDSIRRYYLECQAYHKKYPDYEEKLKEWKRKHEAARIQEWKYDPDGARTIYVTNIERSILYEVSFADEDDLDLKETFENQLWSVAGIKTVAEGEAFLQQPNLIFFVKLTDRPMNLLRLMDSTKQKGLDQYDSYKDLELALWLEPYDIPDEEDIEVDACIRAQIIK